MITVPRWLSGGIASVIAAYTAAFAILMLATGAAPLPNAVALGLFGVAFGLCIAHTGRAPISTTVVILACTSCLPLLGSIGLDPDQDSYSSGAWYVPGVACVVVVLIWRKRGIAACLLLAELLVHTFFWGGLAALNGFGVIAAALIIAVMAAGGWAVVRTEQDLLRFSAAEREALEWEAAQDAYQTERQARLVTTARLASGMLHRIVTAEDGLTDADRFECRVLEQTIRDEIRGRRLLNEAMRDQVIAHRRRGAFVQVLDDGGLDDVEPALLEPILNRAAEAISQVHSDRIIIRTAPKGSDKSVTVVAISIDATAAALGLEDEGEEVDLWLELPRPEGAATPA